MKSGELTSDELRRKVRYEPQSGSFFWLESVGSVRAGNEAGGARVGGYVRIRVNGVAYSAHRLAWLYVHGHWPRQQIDHINGIRHDNRIANLREVPPQQNSQNKRNPHSNSSTGYLGVSRHVCGRYLAAIKVSGKQIFIGLFDDPVEAHAAYIKTKRELHKGCTI